VHEGVRQADMYQAYAYAKEFDCPCVVLLYPRYGDFGSHVASYRVRPGSDDSPRIEVRTVDITAPTADVTRELGQLLEPLLFCGENVGNRHTLRSLT
jgi:5-methylcytosine-specific restriction endonuclease McrBC regulatory subunit McrC